MSGSSVPNNPNSQTVSALLPKLHDNDPDYRFMSLNDLFQVLTIGKPDLLMNDYNAACRTVDGILKTLDDQNGEVQNLAIKCLVPLVGKLPPTVLAPLLEKLSVLTTENSVDNSIPALALRTVVVNLPRPVPGLTPRQDVQDAYSAVSRVLVVRLIGHQVIPSNAQIPLPSPPPGMLNVDNGREVDAEAVDVLIEVVRCFGPMLQPAEVQALQEVVVKILENERATSVIKKRAVVAVSILAAYLPDDTISAFVSHVIECFRNPHLTPVQRRLYITILGSMARSIPQRFGPYLKTLAPFVLSALTQSELEEQLEAAAENGESDPEIDDVRESALVALESFLGSCGSEMRPYTEESIGAALRFLKYDPNYNDDEDEDMADEDEDDAGGLDDEDEDYEAEADFDDDDDDASWKVRRCAAKVLYTLISTRGTGDLLEDGTLYEQVAPVLINRFNEREETVRLEIIATMTSLVKKTGEGAIPRLPRDETADYAAQALPSRKRRRESSISHDTRSTLSASAGMTSPVIEPVPSTGPRADLAKLTPSIVRGITKLMKGKSIPTKQALILLLDNLASVQKGGLADYFAQIVDLIMESVKSSGSTGVSSSVTTGGPASATVTTLRIAALHLISGICETHSSTVLQPYLDKIIPGVTSAVKDRFTKVSSEAVGTIELLIKALTPPRSQSVGQKSQPQLQKLFETVMDRVSANDADLEVRHRAIHALGILLSRTSSGEGTQLLSASDRTKALDLLNERVKNETTRVAAVRAIDVIAALTKSKDQLNPTWIREVSLELAAQLRKSNRSLRGASLGALKSLVTTPAARNNLDKDTVQGLLSSLLPLLTAADLHLLTPSLLVLAALAEDEPQIVVTPALNSALCNLLTSTLGSSVVEALISLVTVIGKKGVGQELMFSMIKDVSVNGDPVVVGKAIGTLFVAGGSSVGVDINAFLSELDSPVAEEPQRCLALAVLGEIGLLLGAKSPLEPKVFTSHFKAGANKSNKVPLAAAVALGRAGAGNVPVFLPVILQEMDKGGNAQYLLLHSIKEILQQSSGSPTDISKSSAGIWKRLLVASQSEDNKAVGAECLGRLAIIEPATYLPHLQVLLKDKKTSVRTMGIQAIRYTLPDADESFDTILSKVLVEMLSTMLRDSDIENRRLGLTTFSSALHNKAGLVLPHLQQLLPFVMAETEIKPELVRDVMMGPFKHKVDDGLELRKGAYETLYSLMETAFTRLNTLQVFDRVVAGLADDHDIRSLCNLMLTKLIILNPEETSRRLDAISVAYRAILSTKLKDTAVKQEVEKQDEAVKGVLRVSLNLHDHVPGAAATTGRDEDGQIVRKRGTTTDAQGWRGYWEWMEKDFEGLLKQVRMESSEASGPQV